MNKEITTEDKTTECVSFSHTVSGDGVMWLNENESYNGICGPRIIVIKADLKSGEI